MLKRFKKYFVSNYERLKLSMSLMLGILALIFLIFYLAGCFLKLWTYNIYDLVFNPLAGSIIVTVPVFTMIIILKFMNYYKTRILFCRIVKYHRDKVSFFLKKDDGGSPDNEIKYFLLGNYKTGSFKFAYSLGKPLMISFLTDMKNVDIFQLNTLLGELKLIGVYFNASGLSLSIRKPADPQNINTILQKLDILINGFDKVMNYSEKNSKLQHSVLN